MIFSLLMLLFFNLLSAAPSLLRYRVAVPVASVWGLGPKDIPIEDCLTIPPPRYCNPPSHSTVDSMRHHLTQVLYGDLVIKVAEIKGTSVKDGSVLFWKIKIPSQLYYDKKNQTLTAYEGWIRPHYLIEEKAAYCQLKKIALGCCVTQSAETAVVVDGRANIYVPFGTAFFYLKNSPSEWYRVLLPCGAQGLVAKADVYDLKNRTTEPSRIRAMVDVFFKNIEGTSYVWAGCSTHMPHSAVLTGIDCSALPYLLLRAQGFLVPRNSLGLYTFTQDKNISPHELQDGACLFVFDTGGEKIKHVVMTLKEKERSTVLESAGFFHSKELDKVRRVDFFDWLKERGLYSPSKKIKILPLIFSKQLMKTAAHLFDEIFDFDIKNKKL